MINSSSSSSSSNCYRQEWLKIIGISSDITENLLYYVQMKIKEL